MKKSLISLCLLLGLVILTGCGNKKIIPLANEKAMVPTDTATQEMNEETIQSTMNDLYKKGGKMTCTMKTTEGGVEMNGILYMDGKNLRSETKGSVQGMNIEMNTIIKDGYSYTRSSMAKEGWKIAYDETAANEDVGGNTTTNNAELPISFVCKKGVSGADFTLPSGIQFKEMK